MLRTLLLGLTLLHLGPGIAFVLLAFGCEGEPPAIGDVCTMGAWRSFATLTVGGWVVAGTGLTAAVLVARARSADAARPRLRLWSLLALLAFGALVGASGLALGGGQAWFLAIPASLAAGWLFVANPQTCVTTPGEHDARSSGGDAA
jgi:hypothetical protein